MFSRWWQRLANPGLRPARRPRFTRPGRARAFKPLLELLEERRLLSIYTEAVLQDSPVAYWRLDETAGSTTALDASGHGATGTYVGGVTLGQAGALAEDPDTAALFDGAGGHVDFANTVAGNDFTVEAWVKTTATSLTGTQAFEGNGLVWSDVSGVNNDWVLAVLNNHAAFFTGNPDTTIEGTTPINDGQYHHIVATRTLGGATHLYVDGVLEASGTSNNSPLNANPRIEVGGNTLDGRYFNGTMDEVAVYDQALSPTRVVAHFKAGLDHAPVASPDTATTNEATPVAVPVLANDADPDGDPLTITAVTSPAHGTAVVNDNGTPDNPADDYIVYTPAADFVGTDSFTYTVSDPSGGTSSQTVTITVLNLAPQVNAGPDATIDEGGTLNSGGSFADPGEETWTATVNYGDGSGTHDLTLNPDKTFALVHTYATTGVYTLTVTVTDSHGGTGSDSRVVTVRNVAPTATLSNSGPVGEGSPVTVSFTNPFDPSPGDAAAGFHYSFALDPSNLAAGYAAAGTAASASFTFDDGPSSPVVYGRIFDRDGGFTDYTTTVVVNNVAPTATLSNSGPVVEGSPATVSFANASDPSSADTAAGFHYSFALDPSGLAAGYAAAGTAASASFTFDDNGSYTVYGRVFDKDGGFTDYQTTVTVTNVAPTATLSNNGPVGEGSPATVSFTNASDPSSADTAAGFHYSFALDPSNLAAGYAAAGTAASASFTFDDGPSSPVVYGRIFDKDGGFTDYQTTVTVTNVAPTATLSNNGPVGVGSPATVSFTNASDPSSADTAAGFHYSFALDPSNLAASYAAATDGSSRQFTFADATSRVVYGRIFDKDGGFTDSTTTITVVSNGALTAGIAGPSAGVRGQTLTFTLTASDPSPANQAAGFTYVVNWGDGTPAQTVGPTPGNGAGVAVGHVFTQSGTYTVQVTATDKDGVSGTATQTVAVTALALQTDPFDPTKVDLVVGGTTGDDTIEIRPAGGGTVRVLFGGVSQGVFAPTGRLVVFGQAGDDALLVSGGVTLPAWLYGGAGDDLLKGGGGNDVLLGGTGDDVLIGGGGRNLLISGGGSDLLLSLTGSDILIAGTTAFDANEAGLAAIMAEWTSSDSFATRVANLTDPGGALASRLNGNYFLLAGGPGQTVFNDGATDLLIGGLAPDLFFAGPGDFVLGFNVCDQVFLDS